MRNLIKNSNKGITLIALVLTIIVLLILAAVTISALTGENGIISNATDAKKQTERENDEEQIKLALIGASADTLGGTITTTDIQNNLDKSGANAKVEVNGTGFKVTFNNDTNRVYEVDEDGNVEKLENDGPSGGVQVGVKAEKNTTIDGQAGTYKNPTIPKGFMAVETAQDVTISSDAKWGTENGWNNGLVIQDASGDATTTGSQFVWVPVQDPTEFVRKYWQNWSGVSGEEPVGDDRFSGTKENETTYEYTQMKNSVTTYGGFYVARYEAGINGTTASTYTNDTNKQTQNGTVKPVSKANVGVWNFIPWGGTLNAEAIDGYQGNDTADGAVKVARSMYPDITKITEFALPETATNTTGVKSTLIYGVQWDAIMDWMKEIENSSATKASPKNKYILDSTGKGNYSGTIAETGSNNNYAVKNIYDMAGNVYEWTNEAYSTASRANRGGYYDGTGSSYPASRRRVITPDYSTSRIGLRVSLFL